MRTDPSKSIPTNADSAEQWVVWHKSLKRWFHKKEANEQWLRFWNQRAGKGSDPDTHELRKYMESQNVNLTKTPAATIADKAIGVLDWTEDTINAIRFIVLGAVVLLILLISYYIFHSTRRGKSISEMVLPLGKRSAPAYQYPLEAYSNSTLRLPQ